MYGRATITESEIIASVKMKLLLQNTTEYDSYFTFLINEGARHLGTLSLFVKNQCDIDIHDGKSELPKGFYRLLGLRFNNTPVQTTIPEGGPFTVNHVPCQPMFYVDSAFLSDCGCALNTFSNIQNYLGVFQINKGFIHYNSSVGISATSANMAWLGFNIDDAGRMILYADYERALTAYCCYNFTLTYSDEYKEATIERWHQEWVNQKSWVKGNDAVQDAQNTRREIAAIATALLVSNSLLYTS